MENRFVTCQDGAILNLAKVECIDLKFTQNYEENTDPAYGEIECIATASQDFYTIFTLQYPASHEENFRILLGEQLRGALNQNGDIPISTILQSVRKVIDTYNGADETMVDALKVMQALLKTHDLPLQERWLRIGRLFSFGGLNAVKLMDDSIAVLSNMCETHLELHAKFDAAAAAGPPAAEAPAPIAIVADGFGDWRNGLDRQGIPYSNPTGMSFETDAMHLPRIAKVFESLNMRFQFENLTDEHQAVPVVPPNDLTEPCFLYLNVVTLEHWASQLDALHLGALVVETKEGPAISVPAMQLEAATDYFDNHGIQWSHDPSEISNEEEE